MLKAVAATLALVPAVAWAAQPDSIAPHNVISATEGDFNGDGSLDRAVLTHNGRSDADLVIYLNDGRGRPGGIPPGQWTEDNIPAPCQ